MKNIRVYQCEDSIEGIFSAIYTAWASRYGHDFIKIEVMNETQPCNLSLFTEYIFVPVNLPYSDSVARSIREKISPRAYEMVIRSALSDAPQKADIIYHFLVRGFVYQSKILDFLSDPFVSELYRLNQNVSNQAHYYKEFIRFSELEHQILFAKIEPKCNITALVVPHFADRLRKEHFMILDVARRIAAIHPANHAWYLTTLSDQEVNHLVSKAEKEQTYEVLWKAFFKSISIKEREDYERQRGHVPLHYRKYMTEFLE